VLTLAGRNGEAAETLATAEKLYAEKGHLVGIAQTQSQLRELGASSPDAV
jgi:hypothetical protein